MKEELPVHNVEWHGSGIFELQLERDEVDFLPGDCMALFGEDRRTSRPYSFASGADEEILRFVIRKMDGGVVSPYLAACKPGDKVKVSPPFGWFRPGSGLNSEPFVFIATGTGIAPFLSHFRTRPDAPPAQCLYGVRKLKDAVDFEWLRTLCSLKLAVSREDVQGHTCGRVTHLLEDMPVAHDIHYYLCGVDTMIDEVTQWLEEKKVNITHIHRECFFNASYSA